MKSTVWKKGRHVTIAAALTMSVALTGCSKDNNGGSASTDATTNANASTNQTTHTNDAAADKNVEITFMDWSNRDNNEGKDYDYAFDEYMKQHPNVTIKRIYQPLADGGYDKLLDTQFVSHKAPDVMKLFGPNITKYTDQGYIARLDGYMKQPTPYNDNKVWVDTFVNGEKALRGLKAQNKFGSISFVPVDAGPGQNPLMPFYYNKDLLDKAGVTEIPKTWAEFIEACKKLKESGVVPVTVDNERFLNWINSWVGSELGEGYLNTFFDKKYESKDLYEDKVLAAVMLGKIGKDDPVVNSALDIVKDFSQYWQEGWAGNTYDQSQQLFLLGKAAFILDGNWFYNFYKETITDFKFGLMPFPLITQETSQYAAGGMPVGGDQVTYGWGINADAEKDPDKMKVIIDIFQYLTSKEVQAKMSEIGVWAPVTADVAVPADLKAFLSTEDNKFEQTLDNPVYNMASDGMPLSQEWLLGQSTKDEYLDKIVKDGIKNTTQRAKDALDPNIGIQNQIKTLQEALDKQKADGAADVVIKAAEESLGLAQLKLEFYKQYIEPAMK
ncbi:ABC transporter substrate-binding protein [Paenibacillus silvisoli]|uniref:ABC transporter substrate-binding protein n=1 Tax=Paenibacillus silvisoli TaxID=3110539 RepID=UPI002805AF66|nr:extracellular solute-binding protein [Paenibacillus silvisoli]